MSGSKSPNYFTWSKDELVLAIKNRTHEEIDRKQKRRTCIKQLFKLDRCPPGVFRLLDLPAELRINIYEALFAEKDDVGRGMHPAILRTSKLIYKEASPVRHENSHASLTIVGFRGGIARVHLDGPDNNKAPLNLCPSATVSRIRRIQNFTVTFEFDAEMSATEFITSGEAQVRGLWAVMISTCEDMQRLKIVCTDHRKNRGPYRRQLSRLLAPLSELSRDVELTYEGLGKRVLGEVPRGVSE
ncbi:hypothetical protein PRZ48_011022 [Zasmidium cellare]|uniref:Uncharacterized protein n=1 Tax=Zasmidium cellare TaxID=395010 RepID=A0ABR0EAA0_ZASCE|nr:hypothetical protein PRZ48_011022 [Zasmidium cellare]